MSGDKAQQSRESKQDGRGNANTSAEDSGIIADGNEAPFTERADNGPSARSLSCKETTLHGTRQSASGIQHPTLASCSTEQNRGDNSNLHQLQVHPDSFEQSLQDLNFSYASPLAVQFSASSDDSDAALQATLDKISCTTQASTPQDSDSHAEFPDNAASSQAPPQQTQLQPATNTYSCNNSTHHTQNQVFQMTSPASSCQDMNGGNNRDLSQTQDQSGLHSASFSSCQMVNSPEEQNSSVQFPGNTSQNSSVSYIDTRSAESVHFPNPHAQATQFAESALGSGHQNPAQMLQPCQYGPPTYINPLPLGQQMYYAPIQYASYPVHSMPEQQRPVVPEQPEPDPDSSADESQGSLMTGQGGRPGNARVYLANKDLWKKFHVHTNEMIITKQGRRMFPVLQFSLRGLDPERQYNVFVDMQLANCHHWKFQNGKWTESGQAEQQPPNGRVYVHPDSPNSGEHWMKNDVVFSKLKLTNNKSFDAGFIVLNSMHKYQPRVHVLEVDKGPQEARNLQTHCFKETEFVAVTAYQNTDVTQLKIDHNPFAKGFREPVDMSSSKPESPNPSPPAQTSDESDVSPGLAYSFPNTAVKRRSTSSPVAAQSQPEVQSSQPTHSPFAMANVLMNPMAPMYGHFPGYFHPQMPSPVFHSTPVPYPRNAAEARFCYPGTYDYQAQPLVKSEGSASSISNDFLTSGAGHNSGVAFMDGKRRKVDHNLDPLSSENSSCGSNSSPDSAQGSSALTFTGNVGHYQMPSLPNNSNFSFYANPGFFGNPVDYLHSQSSGC